MKRKTLHLLELDDDKIGIINLLKEETKDITIEAYVDYRDFEGIERLVVKCKTLNEFKCELQDSYDETITYEQNELIDQLVKKVKSVYKDYDDLSDDLYDYISEYVYSEVEVRYPFDEFLDHLIRVNMFITYDNSTDAEDYELDYTTLTKMLKKLGYARPKTLLKELRKMEYKADDQFLHYLQDEITNAYPTHFNYLTFIGEITIREYYNILENPNKTRINFTHDNYCGFVDPYNGGGSVLGINLPKDKKLTCKGSDVYKLLVEDSGQVYTVNNIYGLTSTCFNRIEVK